MHTEDVSAPAKSAIKGTLLVNADFAVTGIVMTMLGPMLPMFSERWSLNDAQAGYLVTAQFATSMLGMFLSGVLVQRLGYRRALMFGLALMAVGTAMLARGNWALGLVAVSIYGIGFGSNTPAGNLFIADANPGDRASALNLLNSSWGIGAMGSPLLVAWAKNSRHVPVFFYGTAMACVALLAWMSWVRFSVDTQASTSPPVTGEAINARSYRLVPFVAVLFFIYVGTENSVGMWIASYAHRMDTGSRAFWATTPAFFWGALLLGRILAPLFLRRMPETTVASVGLILAALGVAVLLAAQSLTLIVAGASLAGLGLASVFPISISMLSHWFGEASTRVSGIIFAAGNMGGAVLPWVVGALSTHYGNLRVGFIVPLLGATIMLVVYVANGRLQRRARGAHG